LIGAGQSAINPAAGNVALGALPGRNAPAITVPGLTGFTGGVDSATHNRPVLNSLQVYDDAFLTKGTHSVKFGFAFERMQTNNVIYSSGGVFGFPSLSGFLTNKPTSFTNAPLTPTQPFGYRQSIFAGYVQDDVHLRSNLTVNLGLRYEMATVLTEAHGKEATLHSLTQAAPIVGVPYYSNPTLRNFEPRVGFAWDTFGNGKTSVRGGFGLYDVLPLAYLFFSAGGAPFVLSGSAPPPLPPGSFPTQAFTLASAPNRLANMYIQPDPKRNYVMQWNLGIQHELSSNLMASLTYAGSRAVHQAFHSDDLNGVLPLGLTSAGYLWPIPGTGTVLNTARGKMVGLMWGSNTFYDGLQAGLVKRISHGLQVQGAYTWSKCIDDGSGSKFGDEFVNGAVGLPFFSEKYRRGLCDYNIGQNMVINFTWTIPHLQSFHGAAAWAINGWQLGGIYQIHTGTPFTPIIGGDPLGQGSSAPYDVPNRSNGPGCQSGIEPGNIMHYIDTQCFSLPAATPAIAAQCVPFSNASVVGTCANLLGNSGRNSLIGPGFWNFDFALFKNNNIRRISEDFNAQVRVEFFNVFNHPNFASPVDNSTLFNANGAAITTAGMVDSTADDSREIQFALKLIW
jgi:hypothetical protein